ncbi:hypothetical protein [Dehalobacter sp. TeCB1]|uniref:hypothetical protein n=1 Tax=Dehalobacter sp. TeCB1 TaxID=1843715 RepID=UPI00159F1332|nr:hypothetical protein [Dehalobacter sp. TeCB1]
MKKNYVKPQGTITSLRPEERFAGGSFEILAGSFVDKLLSWFGDSEPTIKGF